MKRIRTITAMLLLAASAALADDPAPAAQTDGTPQRASELSEALIYSVDRVPERTFDTARAVEVITIKDIWRKAGLTVGDVVSREAGIVDMNSNAGGGMPIVRGLLGKQVMIMVDGVKLNNATWRGTSKEYLGTIDLSAVERIEIVRGVVSVLGTESLGGVINIITKKGPPDNETFGGSLGSRYSTADASFNTPLELYGQGAQYRWTAGANYLHSGDMHGGSGVGLQPNTSYFARAGHATFQYLLSTEKTVTASYMGSDERGAQRAWQIAQGTDTWYQDAPAKLSLAALNYQDLTDRSFASSIHVTGYFNRQYDSRDEIRTKTPTVQNFTYETDNMRGLNLELGKFLGGSELLYGVDLSSETVHSKAYDLSLTTGGQTPQRGRYTDGAKYATTGIYVQDRFSLSHWVTITAGARYGVFRSSGDENSTFGVISLDERNSDTTGALNVVFHATDNLNLIANVMRGFRAPNIDDLSRFSVRNDGVDVPNPTTTAEHVKSYEAGIKYDNGRFGGTVFYYQNDYTDLLYRQPGTYNGLPFLDQNGNGVRDPKEPPIFQLQNVGTAKIDGLEADFRYAPIAPVLLTGNVTKTVGTDTLADQPLDRIPALYGNLTLGVFGSSARAPWAQLIVDFAGAQQRLSEADKVDPRITANGTDSYMALSIRGGASITERVRVLLGVDNVTNKAYKTHASWVYRPGRQVIVGTSYRF